MDYDTKPPCMYIHHILNVQPEVKISEHILT